MNAKEMQTPHKQLQPLQERDLVSVPLRQGSGITTVKVLKRFEFEPSLMRSGVVVADRDKPASPPLLFVRGAPTKIEELVRGGILPPDFRQVLHSV